MKQITGERIILTILAAIAIFMPGVVIWKIIVTLWDFWR